jgi:hypothetical protein
VNTRASVSGHGAQDGGRHRKFLSE